MNDRKRYADLNREYRELADRVLTGTPAEKQRLDEVHAERRKLAARVDSDYRHMGLKVCPNTRCENWIELAWSECGECARAAA